MNDEDLRKLLLDYDAPYVYPPTGRRNGGQRGAGMLLLTGATILCWVVGAFAILFYLFMHFEWLQHLANRKLPPQMDDVFEWFLTLLAALAPSVIAAALTVVRGYWARTAKLREVNATLIEVLGQMRQPKSAERA